MLEVVPLLGHLQVLRVATSVEGDVVDLLLFLLGLLDVLRRLDAGAGPGVGLARSLHLPELREIHSAFIVPRSVLLIVRVLQLATVEHRKGRPLALLRSALDFLVRGVMFLAIRCLGRKEERRLNGALLVSHHQVVFLVFQLVEAVRLVRTVSGF